MDYFYFSVFNLEAKSSEILKYILLSFGKKRKVRDKL